MVKTTPRQLLCRDGFEKAGYPRSGAAALVGNFCRESGPTLPSAFRKTKLDHGSNGLPQWRLERLTNYENFVKTLHPECRMADGKWNGDLLWPWYGRMDHQVSFVIHELETDYPLLNAKLKKGGDPAALAADVCWQYERPSKALSGIADRVAYAKLLAVATNASPTAAEPTVGVVNHLQAAANTEHVKAQGGLVLAGLSGLGAAGVVLSNFVDRLPTWEWAAIGIALALAVIGIIGHLASSKNARVIEQAVPGVTPNAPPAAEVVAATVPEPAFGAAKPATTVIPVGPSSADIAKMVDAEVERRMALAAQAQAGTTAVVQPTGTIAVTPQKVV